MTSSLLPWMRKPFLLGRKFFSFRIDPLTGEARRKMVEVLPLKLYLFTLTIVFTNLDDSIPNCRDF